MSEKAPNEQPKDQFDPRGLKRRSLLGRDPKTGLPRDLFYIDTEGRVEDLKSGIEDDKSGQVRELGEEK